MRSEASRGTFGHLGHSPKPHPEFQLTLLPYTDSFTSGHAPSTSTPPPPPAEAAAEGEVTETGDPSQSAAYNPETGEINWACPCLGGMADGPCGEEFKAAFSCFIYSEDEPKGVDCVDKFRGMQECFRKYPEIYGAGEVCSHFLLDDRLY